jgi:hypothetical protein
MPGGRPVWRRRVAIAALAATLAAGGVACSGGSDAAGPTTRTTDPDSVIGGPTTTGPLGSPTPPLRRGVRIDVLSSQPDRVSGTEARVRVTPGPDGSVAALRVRLDDVDVTDQLARDGDELEGVVSGFIEGNNTLAADDGADRLTLRIRAWPTTGPMISGPHLPLEACSTEANGLGPPTDADCSAPRKVSYRYVTTDGRVADLPGGRSARPADLATATIGGREVPLVLRVERGVVNRSVYELTVPDPGPSGTTGAGAWNGKLLYRFGGGCGTTYGQGALGASTQDPTYLRRGYAIATATFNSFAVQCNDVLSAETVMMVKERAIELLGRPSFTIGEGASGGAIQLHLLAQNYPGLVNGIVAAKPFPDATSIAPGVTDCGLLEHYYASVGGAALSPAQRAAINGHATAATCGTWVSSFLPAIDPTVGCDPAIPPDRIYDPDTNRGGLRCTFQDANRNQFGVDPATGYAQRPLDNVGVQYGLEALNDGTIGLDQFLDLNERIGGYDLDGRITPRRTAADPAVVEHAYETGRISLGGGDQLLIPIIDINPYTDPTGDVHDRFRAFSLRDRLRWGRGAEAAPGFQIWTREGDADASPEAVAVVDEWLTNLLDEPGGDPLPEVLARTRPAAAVDNCLPPGEARPLVGIGIYDEPGPCRDRYSLAGDPRIAAGGPPTDEVLKCALKPVDLADYRVAVDADAYDRLQRIFPDGVCDWTQAGQGEVAPASPDRSYDDVEVPGQDA